MRKEEVQLIDLLNCAIYNSEPKLEYSKETNWFGIREIAQKHSIDILIYSVIQKEFASIIPDYLLKEWKRDTFKQALTMNDFITLTSMILDIFNKNNIEVIVLKGIYFRSFYPKPDLRTMGDMDILVHPEELSKVNKLMINLGYKEISRNSYHIEYESKTKHCIEVHWSLEKDSKEIYGENIWKSTQDIFIQGVQTKTLSLEYSIAYLIDHMAGHMKGLGFGLRQLIDLTLIVNSTYEDINWIKVNYYIKKANLEKFSKIIFILCNKMFSMKLPGEINVSIFSEEIINEVLNHIIDSGTYGKKSLISICSKKLTEGDNNIGLKVIKEVFPKSNDLRDRFNYAKKYKILLPIAWFHRIIYLIRKYKINLRSIKERRSFYEETVNSTKIRKQVLDILQL